MLVSALPRTALKSGSGIGCALGAMMRRHLAAKINELRDYTRDTYDFVDPATKKKAAWLEKFGADSDLSSRVCGWVASAEHVEFDEDENGDTVRSFIRLRMASAAP